MFRLYPTVETGGTHFLSDVKLPPASVVGRFGHDRAAYWVFVSAQGEVFTLYAGRISGASPFWELREQRTLSIGGHRGTNLKGFTDWLLAEIEAFGRTGRRAPEVPEEFARALAREHLADCSPAERVKGLSAEELLAAIPRDTLDEMLRRLQDTGPAVNHS